MSFPKSVLVILIVLCFGLPALGQDSIPTTYDQNYREDQFYVGLTYNVITDVPGAVATQGLSGGIHFGFLRDIPLNEARNFAVAIGAGLSIDKYGQTLFIGEDTSENSIFSVLDEGVDYNSNSLSAYSVEVPFQIRWRTSTPASYKFWRLYGGFRMGYVYWYKASFRQTNNDVNQTNIPEFDRLRMGASISFGYNTFNFYVYYSINPFFKDAVTDENQTVDFRTIKVGLMFYIL